MSGPDKDIDVRTEMSIALFWRDLITDYEYAKFDPDDMLRWYLALELRGPEEIRELITERYMSRPMKYVVGIVMQAPHPPLWLVREWLEYHEQRSQVDMAVPWGLAGSFVVLSLIGFVNLQSCVNMHSSNPLAMNPPAGTPAVAPYQPVVASYAAPAQATASASAPQAPSQSGAPAATHTSTGPVSAGIAGGASGQVSSTGATGAQNGGISVGATQP